MQQSENKIIFKKIWWNFFKITVAKTLLNVGFLQTEKCSFSASRKSFLSGNEIELFSSRSIVKEMFLGLEFMQFKILLCAVKTKIIKMFCQQIFLFEIGL